MPKETNTYHISWTYFNNAMANKRHKSLQAQLTIDSFFMSQLFLVHVPYGTGCQTRLSMQPPLICSQRN